MGYWNGWSNWEEWYQINVDVPKICEHCGVGFMPTSPRQRCCTRRSDNINGDGASCEDDRYFQSLWDKGRHPLQLLEKF